MRVRLAALARGLTPVEPISHVLVQNATQFEGLQYSGRIRPLVAMTRQTLSDILFWVVATMSAVLLVVLVLVVAGAIPIDSSSEPESTANEAPPVSATAPPTERGATTAPETETAGTTTAPAAPAATLVIVTASRGDSWISARLGSEDGRVLDERVLTQGESAQFRGTRIWLSIGAAGNVDVTVDGKPRTLAPGTVSVVLTPSRTAAADS
jgi:hypothetical protein